MIMTTPHHQSGDMPAFPTYDEENSCTVTGLTKREYFAAAALSKISDLDFENWSEEGLARRAFKIADAMLKESQKDSQ
jgi:hypothetical protein